MLVLPFQVVDAAGLLLFAWVWYKLFQLALAASPNRPSNQTAVNALITLLGGSVKHRGLLPRRWRRALRRRWEAALSLLRRVKSLLGSGSQENLQPQRDVSSDKSTDASLASRAVSKQGTKTGKRQRQASRKESSEASRDVTTESTRSREEEEMQQSQNDDSQGSTGRAPEAPQVPNQQPRKEDGEMTDLHQAQLREPEEGHDHGGGSEPLRRRRRRRRRRSARGSSAGSAAGTEETGEGSDCSEEVPLEVIESKSEPAEATVGPAGSGVVLLLRSQAEAQLHAEVPATDQEASADTQVHEEPQAEMQQDLEEEGSKSSGQQVHEEPQAETQQDLEEEGSKFSGQQVHEEPEAEMQQDLEEEGSKSSGQQVHEEPRAETQQDLEEEGSKFSGQQVHEEPEAEMQQDLEEEGSKSSGQQVHEEPRAETQQDLEEEGSKFSGQQVHEEPEAEMQQDLEEEGSKSSGQQDRDGQRHLQMHEGEEVQQDQPSPQAPGVEALQTSEVEEVLGRQLQRHEDSWHVTGPHDESHQPEQEGGQAERTGGAPREMQREDVSRSGLRRCDVANLDSVEALKNERAELQQQQQQQKKREGRLSLGQQQVLSRHAPRRSKQSRSDLEQAEYRRQPEQVQAWRPSLRPAEAPHFTSGLDESDSSSAPASLFSAESSSSRSRGVQQRRSFYNHREHPDSVKY
eukprot:TRINITY_DN5154_c0_g1_i1.p1 TRINITY_DN5154_c0_g1~~TRINITY_DN5154_c0_g1_i1.p1  ORF type:complete len:688 (-),score=180.67 TRINITY_DN5154_c0_g1_i1:69-2132(-)